MKMTVIAGQSHPDSADVITLENASWELYEMLVRERDAAGQHFKITYDRGRLSIMSPLPMHEQVKRLLGQLVEIATLERDIPRASYGSTTWKRAELLVGMEPDECYYIGHEPEFDRTKPVDLRVHPAPDLAIEVDITRHPVNRLTLYAKLGVREVWRYDGQRVSIHQLRPSGQYEVVAQSIVLPFLLADDINRFVVMLSSPSGEMQTLRTFRDWLQQR
jgi:Uma2 family endonuclease